MHQPAMNSSELMCCPLQVHAYIVSYLKKEMPSLFGREKKKEELLMRLPEIYTILQREHHISPGDFPNVTKMQVQQQEVMSHGLSLHSHLCFHPSNSSVHRD